MISLLGTPLVPFFPFYSGVSLLKLNSRKKGTLIIMGLRGNLVLLLPFLQALLLPLLILLKFLIIIITTMIAIGFKTHTCLEVAELGLSSLSDAALLPVRCNWKCVEFWTLLRGLGRLGTVHQQMRNRPSGVRLKLKSTRT